VMRRKKCIYICDDDTHGRTPHFNKIPSPASASASKSL